MRLSPAIVAKLGQHFFRQSDSITILHVKSQSKLISAELKMSSMVMKVILVNFVMTLTSVSFGLFPYSISVFILNDASTKSMEGHFSPGTLRD